VTGCTLRYAGCRTWNPVTGEDRIEAWITAAASSEAGLPGMARVGSHMNTGNHIAVTADDRLVNRN
jgi:hypothetical protein